MSTQTDMREHFGISAPSVEHRAWQDVEVLSSVVHHLLSACNAPSLHHFMEEALKRSANGTPVTHSGLVSELLGSSKTSGLLGLRHVSLSSLFTYPCELVLVCFWNSRQWGLLCLGTTY